MGSSSHIVLPPSLAAYALLSSYCLCGCVMEHFAVFRGWRVVRDPSQLRALQTASGHGALYTYVVPKAALTVFNACLVASPPTALTGQAAVDAALWFGLAMLGVSWASSALVQVPLQLRIRQTGDQELVRRLYSTTWLRTVTLALSTASTCWMVFSASFRG